MGEPSKLILDRIGHRAGVQLNDVMLSRRHRLFIKTDETAQRFGYVVRHHTHPNVLKSGDVSFKDAERFFRRICGRFKVPKQRIWIDDEQADSAVEFAATLPEAAAPLEEIYPEGHEPSDG